MPMPPRPVPATSRQPGDRDVRGLRSLFGAAVLAACGGVAAQPASAPSVAAPVLPGAAAAPACRPAPLGDLLIYLRGAMNNWVAGEDSAFAWHCDAYYVNVSASGRQEFKIGDEAWSEQGTFGAAGDAANKVALESPYALASGTSTTNLVAEFAGEHTIALRFDAGGKPVLTIGRKTFADPSVQPVTDPVALSVRHDSRDAGHKRPFGAVTAGGAIEFAVSALPGVESVTLVVEKRRLEGNQDILEYTQVARLPMAKQAAGGRERWSVRHAFPDIGVYGYWFEVRIGGKTYVYQNNRDKLHWTRELGTNGVGRLDPQPATTKHLRRFRQTVYRADFRVPAWAKDAVYYYIFPERFRNGDPSNDPKPGQRAYHDKAIEFHANWLDKPWRPHAGDGSDEIHNNDFFGGDLAGVLEKLDYLQSLGINTLYMTPVFAASSNHKYDTADYHNIDPAFGTNADYERLTKEAGRRGIRVIVDVSFNHTGSDSIYFDRFGKYPQTGAFEKGEVRADSPYADWYAFDKSQSNPDKRYRGWLGVVDLPELNKASPSYREFAFGKSGVTQAWLDRGAAGWRMDVAPWVPDDFWRAWRRAVKQHKPDALTIAETWFDSSKFFLGDMFDSTMNYIFRNAVLEYAAGTKASEAYRHLEYLRENYPRESLYALMNLLSSHDQARAMHHFGWNTAKADAATVALAKRRLLLATFFQMVYPGAPSVYYGDEAGVTGGDDPFNRGTYPWADRGGKPDEEMIAAFRRLIALRRDHPVLRHGSLDAPLHLDDHLVVLARRHGRDVAITATNNADAPKTVAVTLPRGMDVRGFTDALTGAKVEARGGRITLTVPALYGTVLVGRAAK